MSWLVDSVFSTQLTSLQLFVRLHIVSWLLRCAVILMLASALAAAALPLTAESKSVSAYATVCPEPGSDAQPAPLSWYNKYIQLSWGVPIPRIALGSETSSPTYKPSYQTSSMWNVGIKLFSTAYPNLNKQPTTKDPVNKAPEAQKFPFIPAPIYCSSSSLHYQRTYGYAPTSTVPAVYSTVLNSQNVTGITDNYSYALNLFGASNKTVAKFQAGFQYAHGPCCNIAPPVGSESTFYRSDFMSLDSFWGKPNSQLHAGPFDVLIQYNIGGLTSPPSALHPVSQGSPDYIQIQPRISFPLFGASASTTGSVSYIHDEARYVTSASPFYSNDYTVNLSKSFALPQKTAAQQNPWGSLGLSFSNFTTSNSSQKFFLLPISTKSTTLQISLTVNALPWGLTATKPSYNFPSADATQRSISGKVIPITISHDDKSISTRPTIAVTVGGSKASLIFDTGSAGLRVFASAVQMGSYDDTGSTESRNFGTGGSGRVYKGPIVTANVTIGDMDLGRQRFQLVTSVCTGSNGTNCSADNVRSEAQQLNADGLFGVDPAITPKYIKSLMPALPYHLGDSFIVALANGDDARVILHRFTSAEPPESYGFKTATIPNPTTLEQKITPWRMKWCYDIPGANVPFTCIDRVFNDTGGLAAHLYLDPSVSLTDQPTDELGTLTNGIRINAWLESAPRVTWNFVTGNCVFNTVHVWPGTAQREVPKNFSSSNGINPFIGNQVLYDVKDGIFGIREVPTEPSFC